MIFILNWLKDKTKAELITKLNELLQEKNYLIIQKEKRAAELLIAKKQLLLQNKEKCKAELIKAKE